MGKSVPQRKTVRLVGSMKGLHEVCVHIFKTRSVIMTVFLQKCRHRVSGELNTMKQEEVKELSEAGKLSQQGHGI